MKTDLEKLPAVQFFDVQRARRLAWGPAELSPAYDVDVDVENGLARARARVDDGAEAAFGETFIARHVCACEQQTPEHAFIIIRSIGEHSDVLTRDDEDVCWCLRIDVAERETLFVLVDNLRRNLPSDDAAKETGHQRMMISAE